MVKRKNKRLLQRFIFLLLEFIFLLLLASCERKLIHTPKLIKEPLVNPMMGFAPWAKNQEYVTDEHTLVYVDLTWRDWEPEPGIYDYENFEESNHIQRWRNEGKRIVFRFVCDKPDEAEHMDIPDWLYEMCDLKGDFYDTDYGKGYSPNYSDPVMIERHQLAIKALADQYGGDGFIAFIQLGSLGHWGEWHVKYNDGITRMPKAKVRDQYVQHYINSFPNTKLMMRRPFAIAAQEGLGLYNDMTGDLEDTMIWLDWIENGGDYSQANEKFGALRPMSEGWKVAPFGGEFTSSITMEEILKTQLDTTLDLLRRSHTTFIGPKVPVNEKSGSHFEEGIEKTRSMIGYRLWISKMECSITSFEKKLMIELHWKNDGIAPMYYNWETKLYLLDENGVILKDQVVEVDLTKVLPEETVITNTTIDIKGINEGFYKIALAIIDPISSKPAVLFAMENNREDRFYVFDMMFEYR